MARLAAMALVDLREKFPTLLGGNKDD